MLISHRNACPQNFFTIVINRIVEASVSLSRVRSFLLCDEHKSAEAGDLRDIGVVLHDVSCAYESKKPRLEGIDIDPLAKELADKTWEVSLLKSQLADAEWRIGELTRTPSSFVTDKNQGDERGLFPGNLLCLKRIRFECNPGELVAIVGGVGCGK